MRLSTSPRNSASPTVGYAEKGLSNAQHSIAALPSGEEMTAEAVRWCDSDKG